MLADALLSTNFGSQGDGAAVYSAQDRTVLVPDARAEAGAASGAMVSAVRELLAIDAQERPTATDILRRPAVFVAVSRPADLSAVVAGPAQRRVALDGALQAVRVRRRHRLSRAVQRSDVLAVMVPGVNGMTSLQLAMDWEAAFDGEIAQVGSILFSVSPPA